MLTSERLNELLARFPRLTVGLLGDLFLDRYLEIEPGLDVASIETGLTAYQVTRVRNSPGALGTVINNLVTLGVGRVLPVTVIGDDGLGFDLRRELESRSVDCEFVSADLDRLTPTYMKPIRATTAGEWEELNRFDVRTCAPLTEEATKRLCERLSEAFATVDGLIVIDHVAEPNWGVVNDAVRGHLKQLAEKSPEKLIFIDSRTQLASFDFGSLKGNEFEVTAAGEQLAAPSAFAPRKDASNGGANETTAARSESRQTAATVQLAGHSGRTAWCTLGERGMQFVRPGEEPVAVPAFEVDGPVDIVGAGDTATSAIVSALLAGASEEEAATVGNLAASITVAKLGTTGTASPEEMRARLV